MAKLSVTKRKLRSAGPPSPLPSPPVAVRPDSDDEIYDDLQLDEEASGDEVSEDNSVSDSDVEEEGEEGEDGSEGEEGEEEEGGGGAGSDDEVSDEDVEAAIEKAVREFVGARSGSDDDEDEDEDDPEWAEDGGEDSNAEDSASDDSLRDEDEDGAGVRASPPRAEDQGAVEESDSEDDGELASRNTIGDVPLEWYRDEKHIGYDVEGKKITKKEKKDQLEEFLSRADDSKNWRKVHDELNDEEVELTKDEIDMIRRLREGRIPHKEVNPYPEYVDWFEYEDKGHPLSSAPEPKRRFIPSKWEAKKVVKLVRSLRKGWISLEKPKEAPRVYDIWGDDDRPLGRTANGLARISATKPKLPGSAESSNPLPKHIPSQEEINGYQLLDEEDRPKFIPKRYDSLLRVPAYGNFINEIFERCLDLYLCPRTRKKRVNINPKSLLPKLPDPKDLKPFPTTCFLEYKGHTGPVNSITTSPCGEWLASGSQDGSVRLWEVESGRCQKIWRMNGAVRHVAWNPNPQLSILAIASENDVVLVDTEVGPEDSASTMKSLLTLGQKAAPKEIDDVRLVVWAQHEDFEGIKLKHSHAVHSVAWHYKGDYFVTVNPDGNTRAVLVHLLSKQLTQNPFKKHRGRVVRVIFHPSRPFMFVATKMHVRIYNLVKQQLSKKLMTGLDAISSMAIHSGGDNLLLGSRDSKLCWFDMDLSTKPYKVIKNHKRDIRAVDYHKTYPLFASCSEDATAHVFHGMVYSDLLQNPLIVPVKVLEGHQIAVIDCVFHPKQPWLFTAGADAVIKLFCN